MNRPTGVTVIAVLNFIGAGICILAAIGMFVGGAFLATALASMAGRSGGGAAGAGVGVAIGAIAGVFCLFMALVAGVVGFGLWGLKEWGRILQIIFSAIGALLQAFGLLGSLVRFHFGGVLWNLMWLGVDAWIIFYLIQPQIKAAFAQGQTMQAAAGD